MNFIRLFEIKDLMSQRDKRESFILIILIIISAFIETLGVALILPFISLISTPEIIESSSLINEIYSKIGFKDPTLFIFFSGITTLIFFVLSIFLKTFTFQKIIFFIYSFEHSLSERLLKSYLNQPYEWFLTKNTSEIGGKLLSDISILVNSYILPIFDGLAQITVCLFLVGLLFIVNTRVTINILLFLSIIFFLINIGVKSNVINMGKTRLAANKNRFETFSEIFGSVKEIKINQKKEIFIKQFSNSARDFAKSQATIKSYLYIPKFIIEAFVFSIIIIYVLVLISNNQADINKLLPLVSVYAVAFYKLLPAVQKMYIFLQNIQYNYPTFRNILKDYKSNKLTCEKENKNDYKLFLKNNIELKDIDYKYPNAKKKAIELINMNFKVGTSTALVGASGSGKTTVIDIILGLLKAEKGFIKLDNKKLENNQIRKLNNLIGYVPQNIFLIDSSLKSNIAFGVKQDDIEIEKVRWAARVAGIDKFIEEELDQGYDFIVGEKGTKFSGGQRQRIAIARALYSKPKVLILDEATSALDNLTESIVINNIKKISANMIIIMVSHRIYSIRSCDNLYLLEKGKLMGEGRFENLIQINDNLKSILGRITLNE